MQQFVIGKNEAGQRFDRYLKKLLRRAPDSFLYKMLRKKNITLNGKKAGGAEQLSVGDEVRLFFSDETFEKFSSPSVHALSPVRELPFPVVYEDTDILIVNKPSGMLSQKAAPDDLSANEYIISYLLGKEELTEKMLCTFRPSVCNRLDRNTSGLLAAGKTLRGLQELSEAFRERAIRKYYRCIVKGEAGETVHIKGWLVKDEKTNRVQIFPENPHNLSAQEIETEYRPVRVENGYSELEVHLITGRTHQIRAHLASDGHPVIGDSKYGDREENGIFLREAGIRFQLLHACRMEFADGRVVAADCGEEFFRAWELICRREK